MSTISLWMVLYGCLALASAGIPSLPARSKGDRIGTCISAGGAAIGLIGSLLSFLPAQPPTFIAAWGLPAGRFSIAIDAISATFLLPIFLIAGLASIYGDHYWSREEHPDTATRVRLFFGLLAGSMVLVVLARDTVLLLISWEVMALAAFFLVTTHDEDREARRAGWVYLAATHVATLALIAMAALLNRASGGFDLVPIPAAAGAGLRTAIFLLALVGFGLKAGIMPLHVWLPAAHANAPSHVSAVMSGVMIKMGIYGIVRISGLLPDPPASWGALLLLAGMTSGVLGVAFAIGQHDLKRLLAYHSIENIGIILLGLGLAMLGRALGRDDWVLLGLAGALLHVWNHGLFKSLLFLSAGAVIHSAGTREIDRMGGMAAGMPRTAVFFLIGAVAICGLPPLNGFVSELFIYIGLFRTIGIGTGPSWTAAALAIPALAMIGALAVACFAKVFGAVFLGAAREPHAPIPHEPPITMTAPMSVIAGFCLGIGLLPVAATPILRRAVGAWSGIPGIAGVGSLVPLAWISVMGVTLLVLSAGGFILLRRRVLREAYRTVGTWDCGYAAPSARMQYTASSFAQMLVGLFAWVLRPHVHRPKVRGLFPPRSRFESHVDDTVLDGAIVPMLRRVEELALRLRVLQHGRIQYYILYVLVAMIGLLLWVLPAGGFLRNLFAR